MAQPGAKMYISPTPPEIGGNNSLIFDGLMITLILVQLSQRVLDDASFDGVD